MGKIMMNGVQYGVGGITDADDVKYTDSQTVKGALDEVKTDINDIIMGTLTAMSGVNISEAYVFKVGKVVTITCQIQVTEAKAGYTKLVDIPVGFRPYRQIFNGVIYDIVGSGGIRNRTALTSGASIYVSETYITAG